jgi:hypothetical protein
MNSTSENKVSLPGKHRGRGSETMDEVSEGKRNAKSLNRRAANDGSTGPKLIMPVSVSHTSQVSLWGTYLN